MVVELGTGVADDVGTRVVVGVAEIVGVMVMVAVLVGVVDEVGAAVRVGPPVLVGVLVAVADAVAVSAACNSVRGVAVGVAEAVLVGVAVFVCRGVLVRVAVDVDVAVAVDVPVGTTCASLTVSGSVRKLATINSPRTPMNASCLNTGRQSAIARAACLGPTVAIVLLLAARLVILEDAVLLTAASRLPCDCQENEKKTFR